MTTDSQQPAIRGTRLNVVLVEDSSADAELVLHELRGAGFAVSAAVVQSPEELRRLLHGNCPDVVLADYNLGQWSGLEALEILQSEGLDAPLILVSGALGDVNAVECIKRGATDYVLKDALARLPLAIHRALQEKRLRLERKRAMEQLAQTVQELARSNRDLEQFAYVASHDLQEPLRMLASYTQLLAERYSGKLDAQADKYIGYAVDGAVRMQTLIQDLLAFSRAGRPGMEIQTVDCNTLFEAALYALQAAMEESHAQVFHGDLPTVAGNRAQLQQVLQNLIGNAIKFHGAEPPVIQVEAKRLANEWFFSVSDNGIGIAPEHRDSIFTVFTRLHTRAEYPGNGIGLAICKKIVEQHGGRIWVEPQGKAGATFTFTLPAAGVAGSAPYHEETSSDEHAPSLVGR